MTPNTTTCDRDFFYAVLAGVPIEIYCDPETFVCHLRTKQPCAIAKTDKGEITVYVGRSCNR